MPNKILTDEMKVEILSRYTNEPAKKLAAEYNVAPSTIYNLAAGSNVLKRRAPGNYKMTNLPTGFRQCLKCKRVQRQTEFSEKDPYCRPCRKNYYKLRYQRQKEKVNAKVT